MKSLRDQHIVRPGFVLDDFQGLEDLPLRFFDTRPGRRAKPDANQRRIGVRENLGAHSRKEHVKKSDRDGEIARNQRPSQAQHEIEITSIEGAQVSKHSLAFFNRPGVTNQPG